MSVSVHLFKDEEVKIIKKYRDKQKDGRLKIRFIAILMLSKNLAIELVASLIGKTVKTIENWYNMYIQKGIDSLNYFNYKPKKTKLTQEQVTQLTTWVKETNPECISMVAVYIREYFHVKYCNEAVRKLLLKNGVARIMPKTTPAKAPTVNEQLAFINYYFDLKCLSEKGTAFLFTDGMHLVHQLIPGHCWGDPKNPPVLKTNSGRQRLNILGAYDIHSHSLIHLTGEENCNADRVIEFFELILKKYINSPKIIIITDNAGYFKAKKVCLWLEKNPKVQIEFLPAYSPNLNLIERLWRVAKKHLVRNKFYEKYKTFRAKVFQFLNNLEGYREELESLMVEKFQIVTL